MTDAEPNRIDRTIDMNAPPEKVWRILTTAKDLGTWFRMTVEGEIIQGADVWMTSIGPGYEGMRFVMRIKELTPSRRFVWQWHPGAVDPTVDYSTEPWTTVTFTLEPNGTGTRLSMSETGFNELSLARRAQAYADNTQGWDKVMIWIQNYAEAAH